MYFPIISLLGENKGRGGGGGTLLILLRNFKKLKLRSWHPVPSLHGKLMMKKLKQWQTWFSWAPKSLQMVTAAMKLKDACSLKEKLWQPRQHIKTQRHYFANKGPSSQSYGFCSIQVWMWWLNHKESWAPKNWCF